MSSCCEICDVCSCLPIDIVASVGSGESLQPGEIMCVAARLAESTLAVASSHGVLVPNFEWEAQYFLSQLSQLRLIFGHGRFETCLEQK